MRQELRQRSDVTRQSASVDRRELLRWLARAVSEGSWANFQPRHTGVRLRISPKMNKTRR